MVGQVAKRQAITNPDRTVISIKREMGSAKWTWGTILYMCGFAYVIALIVYQLVGLVSGEATFGVFTIVAAVALVVLLYLIFRKGYKASEK